MRRWAGSWVRSEARKRAILVAIVAAGFMGFGAHVVLDCVLSLFLGSRWSFGLSTGLLVMVAPVLWWLDRSMDRGGIAGWFKGAEAEESVGQALEYSISMPGCGIAHSVMELPGAGDIDHLVATPAGLWVVETKAGRVPRNRFPRALERVVVSMRAVREWAAAGTPVRGCLVIVDAESVRERSYTSGGEEIAVLTVRSLRRALGSEAKGERKVDAGLAKAVWQLGKVKE